MSDELTLNWKVSFAKGSTEITFPDSASREQKFTVAGTKVQHLRQSIATTATAINLGGITTGGFIFGINRDSTNYLELRSGLTGTDLVKCKAGEPFFFRISGDTAAPYAIANTSACELEYVLIDA